MKTLNATGLKVLKAIHLLSAIGWTGAGICMLILLFNPPWVMPTECICIRVF